MPHSGYASGGLIKNKILIYCPYINQIGILERFSGSVALFRVKNTVRASYYYEIVGIL